MNRDRTAHPDVDPITLEIIRGAMSSTIREMELLMERCAMSPFIKEKKDYFVGLSDRTGRMVASHISASGPGMITPIRQAYPIESMRPGDAYWFNDPYLSDGAVQHHRDMVFSTAVFHDGAVIAFTVTFDLFRLETCGGGGWGDPLARDPMRVRDDVARGFVTMRGEWDDYGVALDPVTLVVDKSGTDDERRRRATPLALIDRGPGFEEAGNLWRAAIAPHRQAPIERRS